MKPINVNPATSATFTVPRWKNRAQIKQLDKLFRTQCPGTYRGLQGRVLFFEFSTSVERDEFLSELGRMIQERGNEVTQTEVVI